MSQGPRRLLRLENVDGVTVVSFVDTKIVTEEQIQEVGEQLYSLVERRRSQESAAQLRQRPVPLQRRTGQADQPQEEGHRGQGQAQALLHSSRPPRGLPDHPARPGFRDLRRGTSGARQVLIAIGAIALSCSSSERSRITGRTRRSAPSMVADRPFFGPVRSRSLDGSSWTRDPARWRGCTGLPSHVRAPIASSHERAVSHTDDAAVSRAQGPRSRRPAALSDGRLLRAVRRGRRARLGPARDRPDHSRPRQGRSGRADGRLSPPCPRILPGQDRPGRPAGRGLRAA